MKVLCAADSAELLLSLLKELRNDDFLEAIGVYCNPDISTTLIDNGNFADVCRYNDFCDQEFPEDYDCLINLTIGKKCQQINDLALEKGMDVISHLYDGKERKGVTQRFINGFNYESTVPELMAAYSSNSMDEVESIEIYTGRFMPEIEFDTSCDSSVSEFTFPYPFGLHKVRELETGLDKTTRWMAINSASQKAHQIMNIMGVSSDSTIKVPGGEMNFIDCLAEYLKKYGNDDPVGFSHQVTVEGSVEDSKLRHVLTCVHPLTDGSVEGWEAHNTYSKCQAVILSAALKSMKEFSGEKIPQDALNLNDFFSCLSSEDILIHEVETFMRLSEAR